MPLLPAPFRDDLGHRVPAAVVTKDVLRAVDADWKRRRALAGLREEGHRGGFLMGLLIGFAMIAMMVLMEAWHVPAGWRRTVLLLIAAVAVGLVLRQLSPWLRALRRASRPDRTRRRFLAALLCPSCAHDLKAIPAREDGVTVCPECGAAWRVEGTEGQRDEGTEGSE